VKTNKTRNTGKSRLKIEWRKKKKETCLHSVSWVYYCQCSLFCLSSLCILSLLLSVFLVLFVFTLYLESTIASVPCFVCLHSVSWVYYCQCPLFCLSSLCILSLLLPVFLVLFVFTLYLDPTIASVPCFVCLHSVSWAYYCQDRVKTKKTRNNGNNRLKIQSEDKQNKEHWQY
jgi:hypothetical protein